MCIDLNLHLVKESSFSTTNGFGWRLCVSAKEDRGSCVISQYQRCHEVSFLQIFSLQINMLPTVLCLCLLYLNLSWLWLASIIMATKKWPNHTPTSVCRQHTPSYCCIHCTCMSAITGNPQSLYKRVQTNQGKGTNNSRVHICGKGMWKGANENGSEHDFGRSNMDSTEVSI